MTFKNANLLEVGQELTVPVPTPLGMGPDFKIIPDSELVFGPAATTFDMKAFVNSQGGYLAQYKEEVDGKTLTGVEIVDRVARDFSVNPRLLLAVLQYQSGWLTKTDLPEGKIDYPMGVREEWRKGLYRQLAWAANNLNRGYYLWRVNGISTWLLGDGSVVPIAATINAGTAGVQAMFAALYGRDDWMQIVSPEGFFATYNQMFGYPFDLAIEPLLPAGLAPAAHAAALRSGPGLGVHRRPARRLGRWLRLGCAGFCPSHRSPGLRTERRMGGSRGRWPDPARRRWRGDPGPGWRWARANRLGGAVHAHRRS